MAKTFLPQQLQSDILFCHIITMFPTFPMRSQCGHLALGETSSLCAQPQVQCVAGDAPVWERNTPTLTGWMARDVMYNTQATLGNTQKPPLACIPPHHTDINERVFTKHVTWLQTSEAQGIGK